MTMKRKVLKVGNASLAVSLPSKWAKDHHLKSGDEVEVSESQSRLIIGGEGDVISDETEIIVPEDAPLGLIHTLLSTAYKKGYDLIRVCYSSSSASMKVQKIVDGLIGYEIVEHYDDYCIVKNIAQAMESESDAFLRKTFQMTMQLSELCFDAAKSKKFDRYDEVQNMRENITKYVDFVKRVTNKKRHSERTMIFSYLIITSLEKSAYEYFYIYRYMQKQAAYAFSQKTLTYFKKTNELLRLFYEVFYSRDHYKIAMIRKIKDQHIYEDMPKLMHEVKGKDSVAVLHLCGVARRVQDMTGPFFAIML